MYVMHTIGLHTGAEKFKKGWLTIAPLLGSIAPGLGNRSTPTSVATIGERVLTQPRPETACLSQGFAGLWQ